MQLKTTGESATQLGVSRDQVNYAIRKMRIEPIGTAGVTRIFSDASVIAVWAFLEQKRARKCKGMTLAREIVQ